MANRNTQTIAVTMYPAQLETINALAGEQFDGNVSMALRRIVDEWAQFRYTQLPLPGITRVIDGYLGGATTAQEAMQAIVGQLSFKLEPVSIDDLVPTAG